ncbi:MAG: bacillithiol biosynthesis cysteine-adding enzyme BshC [Fodinibius sp.]|nr:bacillithiol biosynthesis cysteine-adding enzyme BshC [Fodinibius sp.]
MQVSNYSFDHLPFSELFKTYVHNFDQLSNFYDTNPFDEQAIAKKIDNFTFTGDRDQLVEILTAFNEQFDTHKSAQANIRRLGDEQTLAVVTGQQLGIYGGPLYTVLKTISVIHIARKLEQRYNRPVVPVFWLADEDHDYEEIRSITVLNNDTDDVEHHALPSKGDELPTVAEMAIPEQIEQLREALQESFYQTDFSDDLWELLDSCFKPGQSFRSAFGQFISSLFSEHGLVLAGSNHPKVKQVTANALQQSVAQADAIRESLETQTAALSDRYHQQVTLYDSNLFYLDEDVGRTKISRNSNGWHAGSARDWDFQQLVDDIDHHPHKFSPNVFMRPILQDMLLPTLGYVAGPGETAYFGQMKGMYSCFDLDMPVIFPRLSVTIVEPAIDRIINELPFEFHEFSRRIEDLESDYVDRTEQRDLEAIFDKWKEDINELVAPRKEDVSAIDPTLEGAVEKSTARYFSELDKLKGKVYRAVKKKDDIQLKRIRRIKANLFPDGSLQERTVAGIFFMNKYGIDIWDHLLDSLDQHETFDHHKLLYL